MGYNIVILEDDVEFAEFLGDFLQKFGINVSSISDYFRLSLSGLDKYDLLILDLTLDGIDGLEILKQIRQKSNIPIIISSARGDISDKIIGFERGADDYVPKPYDPNEMYFRILSLLKRADKKSDQKPQTGSIYAILLSEIYCEGSPLALSVAEFDVMNLFIKNFGHIVTKEQISNSSYHLNDTFGKSIEMLISRLRVKLKNPTDIVTVRGMGYKLVR